MFALAAAFVWFLTTDWINAIEPSDGLYGGLALLALQIAPIPDPLRR